jgi:hypothetical protein
MRWRPIGHVPWPQWPMLAATRCARTGHGHRACGRHGGVAGGGGSVADEVNGLSKRGSRAGHQTRGGGDEAY